MVQVVSRQPVTTQTQIRSQGCLVRILVGQDAKGRVSVQVMRSSQATCHPYNDLSFITDDIESWQLTITDYYQLIALRVSTHLRVYLVKSAVKRIP